MAAKGIISPKHTETKTIINGNSKVGQVDYIRQAHQHSGVEGDLKRSIAFYQLEIFKYLEQQRYQTIFTENPHIDEDGYLLTASLDVQRYFGNGINLNNPTNEQLETLYKYGADVVYSIINKSTRLMRTQNTLLLQGSMLASAVSRAMGSKMHDRATLEARERYTARLVREHLDSNPGETVALVYGANHNFGFDFKRDLPLEGWWIFRQPGERKPNDRPTLKEISFPQSMNLVELAQHYENIFSSKFLKQILSTSSGYSRFKNSRERFKQRQAKRDLKGQIKTAELVDVFEKSEKESGNIGL